MFSTEFPAFTPSDFGVGVPGPNYSTGFAIVGAYQKGDVNGMTVSSPDDSPIVNGATWGSALGPYYGSSEQAVADSLASGSNLWVFNSFNASTQVPFNTQVVLINYSDAAYGGTAIATVVPEPTTWMLLVTGAGLWLGCARLRRG